MKKNIIRIGVLLLIVFALVACNSSNNSNTNQSSGEPIKWTMSTIYQTTEGMDPQYNSLGASMGYFIQQVNEKSDGRLVIEGFYGGVLGNAINTFQQMERNEIQIYFGQPMSTVDKKFGVWSIPYLFTNYQDAIDIATDRDGEFFAMSASLFDGRDSMLLANGVSNIRGIINSKHRVTDVGSVNDLKLRTYEDNIVNDFWGGITNAIPMSVGDVYTALQTNAIDGLEFASDSIISLKYHEVAKYYSDINWQWTNAACFVVNRNAYESLPEDLQEIVLECAWDAANHQSEQAVKDYETAMEALSSEYGVEVYHLTDEERQTWIDYGRSMEDEFKEYVGEDLYNKAISLSSTN